MEEPKVFFGEFVDFFFFFFFATPSPSLVVLWAISTPVFWTAVMSCWAPRLPDSIISSTVSLISYVSSFMQSISEKTQ